MASIKVKKFYIKYKGEYVSAYYAQWDAEDLDSWQGKEIDDIRENELTEEDIGLLKIEEDFSDLMTNYDLSWRDFF